MARLEQVLFMQADTKAGPVRTAYAIRMVIPHPQLALAAVRLVKLGQDGHPSEMVYDVHMDYHGNCYCTCGDATFRQEKTGEFCKHAKALLAVGLLPRIKP